ncbi:hypothetical protein KIN20_017768 [Parelaphostrongylus tenuis]|uniref:Uncharacterized protein n=1 Tax=Parelaphostrongylus tenuis TaxID=148309 RepID=A0AAD5N179_PARTN|nr:hypothetical protein KIN20_017768 [Parelaphostrongylus tenuis]
MDPLFDHIDEVDHLNSLVPTHLAKKNPNSVWFVQIFEAFPSVETNAVPSVLVDQGVDPSYIRLLSDLYHENTAFSLIF